MQEAAKPAHKVIITGTGRSGTTFLVRLLTELGLDTGISAGNWDKKYFENCNAGLEHNLLDARTPYIVKNPSLCETLPAILATGRFVIDHAYVPIRALDAAAASRIDVGGANGSIPGGLWKTADPALQKGILAESFHTLVHTLVEHDIPMTFMEFPRLVNDSSYTFAKLEMLLQEVSWMQFRTAFYRVADPSLVHDFRPGSQKVGRAPIPAKKRGFFASLIKPLVSLI